MSIKARLADSFNSLLQSVSEAQVPAEPVSQEGKVIKELRYAALPLHKQFMTVAKPLHTGEIMGLGSIIVYFIVTLIGASLKLSNKKWLLTHFTYISALYDLVYSEPFQTFI